MLVLPVYARRATEDLANSTLTTNQISSEKATGVSRFVEAVDPPIPLVPLPAWVDPADYIGLNGGGYAGKLPDTFEKSTTKVNRSFSSTPADRFVRVETKTFYEGQLYGNHSAGDGVTPFAIPPEPNPQFASISMGIDIKFPGDWRESHTLYYESGRIETFEREYTVNGDPSTAFENEELYVNGLPVPQYAEDWQALADFWNGRDEPKRIAAQAKADAASPTPTAATHPYQFALNTTDGTAPADIQQAKVIAETGQTAAAVGITAFESLVGTNPVQAVLNELNHYSDIVQSWDTLAGSTSNPNLKAVAEANKQDTYTFMDLSRGAHNRRIPFSVADVNWQLYEQYMAWFSKQSVNTVVGMRQWDLVLGRPD